MQRLALRKASPAAISPVRLDCAKTGLSRRHVEKSSKCYLLRVNSLFQASDATRCVPARYYYKGTSHHPNTDKSELFHPIQPKSNADLGLLFENLSLAALQPTIRASLRRSTMPTILGHLHADVASTPNLAALLLCIHSMSALLRSNSKRAEVIETRRSTVKFASQVRLLARVSSLRITPYSYVVL